MKMGSFMVTRLQGEITKYISVCYFVTEKLQQVTRLQGYTVTRIIFIFI
jgi:hypothetical protein